MNDLLDMLDDLDAAEAIADGTVLEKHDSYPDGVRCIWCREPLVPAYAIVQPYRCEVAHMPVDGGWCGLSLMRRNQLAHVRDSIARYGEPDTGGNCFATAHKQHVERNANGWFGFGQVPIACLEAWRDELEAWLAEHERATA